MTDDELKELERLAEAATPGPWEHVDRGTAVVADLEPGPGHEYVYVVDYSDGCSEQGVADCAFIAASRTAVPALIAALRAERALADRDQLAAAKEEIARLKQDLKDARAVIENLWSTTNA